MMRSRPSKISKLMQITKAAIRILSKARDSYVKGMLDFAGGAKVGCGSISGAATRLPKSVSVNSSREANEEEMRQLLRLLSKEESEGGPSYLQQYYKEGDKKACSMNSNEMRRSYSVGLGKIGRIDEDRPCSFREDVNSNLYPRSKSHAVGRKVIVYH